MGMGSDELVFWEVCNAGVLRGLRRLVDMWLTLARPYDVEWIDRTDDCGEKK